jgi:hypothetical protein
VTDWKDKVRRLAQAETEVRRILAEKERLAIAARRLQADVDLRARTEARQVALRQLEAEAGAVLGEISSLRIRNKLTEIRDQIWLAGEVDQVLRAHLSWGAYVRFGGGDDIPMRSFRAYGYQLSFTHRTFEANRSRDNGEWVLADLYTIDRMVVLYRPIIDPENLEKRPYIEIFLDSVDSTKRLYPTEAPVDTGRYGGESPCYRVYTDEQYVDNITDFYLAHTCRYMMDNRLLPKDMEERQNEARVKLEQLIRSRNSRATVSGEDREPPLLQQVLLRWLL